MYFLKFPEKKLESMKILENKLESMKILENKLESLKLLENKPVDELALTTPSGMPYTDDEIMVIVREGKQRGHIPGVGRVLPGQGTIIPPPPPCTHTFMVVKLKQREKRLTRHVNMFMNLFRSDDKFFQMLTQLESQPKYGGGSGSGGCGDDEPGDDEDGGEDEEDVDS
nr:hypothetical protein [Tanacetum cinerariifolium]